MPRKKLTFKNFIFSKPSKPSKHPKRLKKSVYGVGGGINTADGGGIGESAGSPSMMHNGVIPGAFSATAALMLRNHQEEEEDEEITDDFFKSNYAETEEDEEATKIDSARSMFRGLVNQGLSRREMITMFMKRLGVTESTAVSYYERIAKEAGMTNLPDQPQAVTPAFQGGMMAAQQPDLGGGVGTQQGQQAVGMPQAPIEEPEGVTVEGDPDKQGLIRTVKGAHLVYKRQEEEGTFEELWIFNTGKKFGDEYDVRHAILAGTDIPPKKTRSDDGNQEYFLSTLGNAQLLHIKGLPN